MKVFVYFNLHRKCWSVKALEGPSKGRVIMHTLSLLLTGCAFKVSEAGRQRVLKERRKNVHAGVVGYLCEDNVCVGGDVVAVSYNPYKAGHFYAKDTGAAVYSADVVQMHDRRVLCRSWAR